MNRRKFFRRTLAALGAMPLVGNFKPSGYECPYRSDLDWENQSSLEPYYLSDGYTQEDCKGQVFRITAINGHHFTIEPT